MNSKMSTRRLERTCVQEHHSNQARSPSSLNERHERESLDTTVTKKSLEDEAARRKQEMEEWQHDWQVLGRWLMSGATAQEASERAVVINYQCDSPLEDEELGQHDDDNVGYNQHQENSTLLRSLSTPSPGSQRAPGRQLEKRSSLRARMQRGVSDGYVLALKTVAAVRRVGRDKEGLSRGSWQSGRAVAGSEV